MSSVNLPGDLVRQLSSASRYKAFLLLEYERGLGDDEREDFWDSVTFPGSVLDIVDRATFFWAVWTTVRVWDTDAPFAYSLKQWFNREVENEVRTADERRFVESIRNACPYLTEMNEADHNWTNFRLPAERT